MKSIRHGFTLVEMVVAMAILSGSLAALFSLAAGAQKRLFKARAEWLENHLMEQAAEFYLLGMDRDPEAPPDFVFDEKEYIPECFFADAEDLPEDFLISSGQAELVEMRIRILRASTREPVRELRVEKIDYRNLETGNE